jgi:hypothetical protein
MRTGPCVPSKGARGPVLLSRLPRSLQPQRGARADCHKIFPLCATNPAADRREWRARGGPGGPARAREDLAAQRGCGRRLRALFHGTTRSGALAWRSRPRLDDACAAACRARSARARRRPFPARARSGAARVPPPKARSGAGEAASARSSGSPAVLAAAPRVGRRRVQPRASRTQSLFHDGSIPLGPLGGSERRVFPGGGRSHARPRFFSRLHAF